MSEAKEKLLQVIPYLRQAMAEAKQKGEPQIGILATTAEGSGQVIARFRADEFVDDLCEVLGVSKENTEDERLEVAAERIVQMVRNAGGSIVNEVVGSDE